VLDGGFRVELFLSRAEVGNATFFPACAFACGSMAASRIPTSSTFWMPSPTSNTAVTWPALRPFAVVAHVACHQEQRRAD